MTIYCSCGNRGSVGKDGICEKCRLTFEINILETHPTNSLQFIVVYKKYYQDGNIFSNDIQKLIDELKTELEEKS